MKTSILTTAIAAALFFSPVFAQEAEAQTALPTCSAPMVPGMAPDPHTPGQFILTCVTPGSAPEVLVNLHGLGPVDLTFAEAVMTARGGLRISAANMRPGEASRERVMETFGDLWLYAAGQSTPSLLIAGQFRGDLEAVQHGGRTVGVSYQSNPGGRVTRLYPTDGCGLDDHPASPNLWVCLVKAN